jgi:hypothetical protein
MPIHHQESRTQSACVRWFRLQYPEYDKLLISVPNGVATSATQGRILKAEGMVAGAADLLLLLPNHNHPYLCIEMKTDKGRQSSAQKEWQQAVENKALARYAVVRSVEEFMTLITDYLNNR